MDSDQQPDYAPDLPQWLWLWLPLTYYLFRYGSFYLAAWDITPSLEGFMHQETGFIELVNILFLLLACGYTLTLLIKNFKQFSPLLRALFTCYLLGCFFIAGEEASWGQHYFHWETPSSFNNVQNETNLHNAEGVMTVFNRLRLGIGHLMVLFGGVLPIMFLIRQKHFDPATRRWWWFWPTHVCIPTAVCILIASLPGHIKDLFDADFPVTGGTGEFKESFMGLFFFLYICSLFYRIKWMNTHERQWLS